jgi:hypothetical protein
MKLECGHCPPKIAYTSTGFAEQCDAGLVARADKRGEAAHASSYSGSLRVLLVGQIDREQRVEVARDRLQRLARLRDVAHSVALAACASSTRCRARSGLVRWLPPQMPQMRGVTISPGLRVLAAQDDLEAAEHRASVQASVTTPSRDRDPQVEIALDAAERADLAGRIGMGWSS